MRTIAILPVKGLAEAKQRLARELAPELRQALAEAMLADVLTALGQCAELDAVLVVSGASAAHRIARDHDALVIHDHDRGHNAAASRGIGAALEWSAERALLVPGDCPLLDPAELDQLLGDPVAAPAVLVVPDRHGTGTNALLLSPPGALAPSFGPGSCARHLADANRAGVRGELVQVPSLALDIDTPEDLAAIREVFAVRPDGAPHTRAVIGQLARC